MIKSILIMNAKIKGLSIAIFQTIFLSSLFFLYAIPCIGRFFYRDDFAGIFLSRINSLSDLWRLIGQPLPGNFFYRPIGNLSYLLDWSLWGPNAFMYFLHSILWQLLSIYLIYKIVKLMTGNEYIAIMSEALFLLYFPMNSGSISLLSNRHAVMAIVFCLLSFYCFSRMRKKNQIKSAFYLTSVLFFALAVFTKELSVPFVFVFMVADFLYFKEKKVLWIAYLPYFAVLILRYMAGVTAKVSLPLGGTASNYSFVFGINIINNAIYYLSWLLLPAIVVIATLSLLSLMNRLKIDWNKAFPREISVFGLSFALINVMLYLPFAEYRQLGWLHMSTIGMAIFLATPTYYFLNLLSSKQDVKKSLIFAAAMMMIFLVAISAVFLPSKLILRNRQAGYSKQFIKDFIGLNIGKNKSVYVVDIGSKDYRLSDTFISPMERREVLYEAICLFMGKIKPQEVHLIDRVKDIRRIDADTVILIYKNGKLAGY